MSVVPANEALAIARQIAEAPEAAHEHGIIHRFSKPASIKIIPDDVVKVLDLRGAERAEARATVPRSGVVFYLTGPWLFSSIGSEVI